MTKYPKNWQHNHDCNVGSYIYCPKFIVLSAYTLTRYFNCDTRSKNGNGIMTMENVKGCYYKVFQGARDADAEGNKI